MEVPETRYAKSGSYHIAYQVFGEGAFDLVIIPAFVSHLEMWWEQPRAVRGLRQLASFARVIMFDKRGTGMSDRVIDTQLPTPRRTHRRCSGRHGIGRFQDSGHHGVLGGRLDGCTV